MKHQRWDDKLIGKFLLLIYRPPQPQGSLYGLPPHTRLPPYHGPGPFHHPGHPGNPNVRPGMQEYQSNYY